MNGMPVLIPSVTKNKLNNLCWEIVWKEETVETHPTLRHQTSGHPSDAGLDNIFASL